MTTETQIFNAVWSVIRRRILDRGVSATELCDNVIRRLGRLHRVEGRLRAGDTVLDQDNTLLPLLARATSLGITLYHGNRRIASTSALGVGKPGEIGGYADAELVDVVLRKREIFKGSLKRNGLVYLVTARPLYPTTSPDETAPIGMIEAFQSEQSFYESLVAAARIGVEQRTAAQEEAADGMEGVIHFLDDVARRLQLLALNGNIIAAQAGEYGRAFRVVCRELGTLADRAKSTVTDVRKLMQTMGLEPGEGHGEEFGRARGSGAAGTSEGDPPLSV
ncbi:Methyl-accepting chemotaxis protein (MCP) signalling domain-containing protein [Nannocystis exedens]|uniref:Methyl-accepting chemotaxis protein (MCP) signalling domain-containing protein n=1 Tax=Nannocystis exedens TaxID=54 RepID=A0A1I1SX71_9BACT|nr:methyl-accepting chemotaxis protein [Nannocystis exedens]PCC66924.1 methyl-accepting chemotaxis sensory transducer [Nannocystis exedens]SFD51065.1 Methyl-accepting chemotaxis protein (MCP) signalling domain-containing protein [Nannocystis exedens]